MLILTRSLGETIVIGDNIHIVVTQINGNKVRLGIRAPKDISVHRLEIYERIQNENEDALDVELETLDDNQDYDKD